MGVKFVGRTINGGVEADSLNGDAEGYTVNGSVKLSTTGLALASTVNGSLNLSMGRAEWPNGAKFSTVNGGITLRLPTYLAAQLNASTENGDISSDFPITVTGQVSRRRLTGTIGNGRSGADALHSERRHQFVEGAIRVALRQVRLDLFRSTSRRHLRRRSRRCGGCPRELSAQGRELPSR
jgi:hypothetical protein